MEKKAKVLMTRLTRKGEVAEPAGKLHFGKEGE